jgi:hypothetical protein
LALDRLGLSSTGDVPTDAPVADPVALKSLLDGAVGGATLPAHGRVENEAHRLANGTGYVVTHIPQGLNVPYRTVLKGEKEEYYIRAGSNFLPTPHAVLAGLFGRAPHSILEIDLEYVGHREARKGAPLQLKFRLSLRNVGRGFAKGVFLSIDGDDRPDCIIRREADSRWKDWSTKNDKRSRFTAVATEEFPAIPPGSEVQVLTLAVELPSPLLSSSITINILVGAETGPGSAYDVTIPADTLGQVIEILTHAYDNEPNRQTDLDTARSLIETCLNARP